MEIEISIEKLTQHFFENHDPTQLNRQGNDVGTQYRSIIFYYSEEQKNQALQSKKQKQLTIKKLIVTEIIQAKEFYLAEEYHQLFINKRS